MENQDWRKILAFYLSSSDADWELGYLLTCQVLEPATLERDALLSVLLTVIVFSPVLIEIPYHKKEPFIKKIRQLLQKEDAYFFRKLQILENKVLGLTDKYARQPKVQYQKIIPLFGFKRYDKAVLVQVASSLVVSLNGRYPQLVQWQTSFLLANNAPIPHLIDLKYSPLFFFIPTISLPLAQILTHCQRASFSQNGLAELPTALYQNHKLEGLSISSNPITELAPACKNWSNLISLDLYHCKKLRHFPKEMAAFQKLQRLEIAHCQLEEIPAAVCSLTNLRYLRLYANKLQSIPPQLAQLENLIELELNHNPTLKTIPDALYKLPKLERLSIKTCGLTDISPTITEMKTLRDLRLSHNKITALPPHFTDLENLYELHLDGCDLVCGESFWETILAMKNLNLLQISGIRVRTDIYRQYQSDLIHKFDNFIAKERFFHFF